MVQGGDILLSLEEVRPYSLPMTWVLGTLHAFDRIIGCRDTQLAGSLYQTFTGSTCNSVYMCLEPVYSGTIFFLFYTFFPHEKQKKKKNMALKVLFTLYTAVSLATLISIIIVVNWTGYSEHYLERMEKYNRAALYLNQDVCMDDAIKAQLGDYTNCERSKRIMQQSVRWLAITDCARDVAGWMGLSGAQFTDTQVFKLGLVGAVIIVLGFLLGIFRLGANREITLAMQPILPSYTSPSQYCHKKHD